jgi:hypothetical protein
MKYPCYDTKKRYNIKIDVKEGVCEKVNYIELAKARDHRLSFVVAILNFPSDSVKAGNFWSME